jgi:hypothetical protein
MNFNYKRESLGAGWVGIIGLSLLVTNPASWMPWLVVSVVAIAPAVVLLHLTKEVPQTISQRIQSARR